MLAPASPTLFTLGYQRRSQSEFVRLLIDTAVDVLVDVRETAWSHKPGFSKRGLQEALRDHGIAYVHAPFVGNPRLLRATAATHDECLLRYAGHLDAHPDIVEMFDELVGRLLDAGKRVCLTCFERHPDDCHRGVLAERWRRGTWRRVEHLAVDEACRLSRAEVLA